MIDGKWIDHLRADMPMTEAARQVLSTRLAVVAEYLPLAKRGEAGDPENVHQLRVATRRADAAVRIFRLCLRKKVYRATRERLRTIRRAAGAARDWDVFLSELRERLARARAPGKAGLDFLVGFALGQRHAAEQALAGIEEDQDRPFAQFVSDLLGEIDLPSREDRAGLGELARTLMPALLARLERAASEDLSDYARLHQVRIAGKRLRYAMEVLVDCFAAPFRDDVYPQVELMQDVLGLANDSHVACQRLWQLREDLRNYPDTWGRVGKGIEGLLRFHQDRLVKQRKLFLEWWADWHERPIEEVLPGLAGIGA
jgi:CHAD domain-containing protein